jgi:hypothetical protein
MPDNSNAIVSSEVATGRRMNGAEIFIAGILTLIVLFLIAAVSIKQWSFFVASRMGLTQRRLPAMPRRRDLFQKSLNTLKAW